MYPRRQTGTHVRKRKGAPGIRKYGIPHQVRLFGSGREWPEPHCQCSNPAGATNIVLILYEFFAMPEAPCNRIATEPFDSLAHQPLEGSSGVGISVWVNV